MLIREKVPRFEKSNSKPHHHDDSDLSLSHGSSSSSCLAVFLSSGKLTKHGRYEFEKEFLVATGQVLFGLFERKQQNLESDLALPIAYEIR